MNNLSRWMAFASVPAVLLLRLTATHAFTDANAELQEAAKARVAVAAVDRAVPPPARMVWVPASVKSLEGFRPVFADEQLAAARSRGTVVAQAGAAASSARR